jgi:hypothetical protein
MPLNTSALESTDKLRREQINGADGAPISGAFILPDLGPDEYIEIRHVRSFSEDNLAEMSSMRRMAPIPLDAETAEEAASKEPVLRRREDLYWHAVWEYMCVRLHVQIDGEWSDRETPRGSQQARDQVFNAWGAYLTPAFQVRFGSIAPLIPDGEVNLEGTQLDFRNRAGLRIAKDPAQVPASEGADRTRHGAQAGARSDPS